MVDPTIRTIFEERARALARRPAERENAGADLMVTLTVAGERYGVDARHVVEVGLADGITPVPGLPPVWAGMVNIRGSIWPVLDMRNYLGVRISDPPAEAPILVFVSLDGITIGLLSDTAPDFHRVPSGTLSAPVDAGGPSAVVGVTTDFLTILDVEQLVNDSRLAQQPMGG